MKWIDKKYMPSKNDLVAAFSVNPEKGIESAARDIAMESSTGTWTSLGNITKRIEQMSARVFEIRGNYIKIAYPEMLFETCNMAQILSSVAGNIFGMKSLNGLRLEDIGFPEKFMREYKGPEFGIHGVRRHLKVRTRPLVGTIVKPKLGLKTKQHAEMAYNSWVGGCDIIKDDENLSSQRFNPFKDRIVQTLEKRDLASRETGEAKAYMPNITAETDAMLERMDFVKENGGKYVMVDVLTAGFSGVQTVRKHSKGMIMHAHRAMHGAITRGKDFGISMLALAKIFRLIGVDQIHIGTIFGKMEGGKEEVVTIHEAMANKDTKEDNKRRVLQESWGRIKPVFSVCSGGVHPRLVPKMMEHLGNDIIIQAGGGIHGHPDGSEAGAMAMRQAVDSAMKKISIEKYAKNHRELEAALKMWG